VSAGRVVVLRHGRTGHNLRHVWQGQLDVPLDEVGIRQSQLAARVVAALDPVAVVTSDLVRASATAQVVADVHGLPLKVDERLREVDAGRWQGLTRDEIIAAGDKALVFTQYAEFGRMLQPYLSARIGCPVLFLHGGTTKKQRDEMVARFQSADEPVLFLLSLKAGGTGLNLTAANHVIHVDRWWNPAVEDQATDRAFRIGQRRDVQVRKFVCVGTLEERIDAMIEQKKALAEQIVGTGESWLTELSAAALREVLTLSPEAVSS